MAGTRSGCGAPWHSWTRERDALIQEAQRAGTSLRDIGARLGPGWSPACIMRRLQRLASGQPVYHPNMSWTPTSRLSAQAVTAPPPLEAVRRVLTLVPPTASPTPAACARDRPPRRSPRARGRSPFNLATYQARLATWLRANPGGCARRSRSIFVSLTATIGAPVWWVVPRDAQARRVAGTIEAAGTPLPGGAATWVVRFVSRADTPRRFTIPASQLFARTG